MGWQVANQCLRCDSLFTWRWFSAVQDAVYQTTIFLSVDSSVPLNKKPITLKPFQQKFYIDFQSKFFAEKLFEDWKESNSNTSLVFEELSTTEVVDGFVLLKNEGEQLVSFELDKVDDTFILVNTNRLPLVLDVFKYANHINEMLTRDYAYQAKNDLKNTEVLIKKGGAVDGSALENILSVKRFIDEVEKGANVLIIQRPTMPKKSITKVLYYTRNVFSFRWNGWGNGTCHTCSQCCYVSVKSQSG